MHDSEFIAHTHKTRGMVDISYIVIIGIIAVISIYIIVALYIGFNKNNKPYFPTASVNSKPASQSASIIPKLNGEADKKNYPVIAQNLLDWIDKQKTPTGAMISFISCTVNGCEKHLPSKPTGAYVLWAHYQHYLKTRKVLDKDIMDQILTAYLDPAVFPDLQNAYWGCKLLYEVASSNLPEIAQMKDRLAQLCKRNFNNPEIIQTVDTEITDKSSLEPDIDAIAEGKFSPLPATTDNYIELALLSAEYTARFSWFAAPQDMERAQMLFRKAAAQYNPTLNSSTGNTAALGIAALDLYTATGNESFKIFANRLAKEKTDNPCSDLNDCALTTFFARSFFTIDPLPEYTLLETKSLSNAIYRGYDKQGYGEGYLKDLGAFHAFGNNETVYYSIMQNAIMAGMLSQQ